MTPERLSEIKKICARVPFINNGVGVAETQQAFHDLINALISDAERLAAAEARLAEVERERDTLTRQVKVLREASENMHSFIVVMYGKPDGSVPEIVTAPLGTPVKLGKIVAQALAALTSEGAEG